MEFNSMISYETQEKLQIIERLSRSGVLRIAKTGSEIKKIIDQLKELALQLPDQDQTSIHTFYLKFRDLIKHHKEYIRFNSSISRLGIEEQINLLTEKFNLLDQEATQLKNLTKDFFLQKKVEIQQGQLGSLPQNQVEIQQGQLGSLPQNQVEIQQGQLGSLPQNQVEIKNELQENVIEQTKESITSEKGDNVDLPRHTTIWELSIPLKINSIKRYKPKAFSKWMGILQPEFQVQYLKTASGNQFFIGINCNLNLNFSNFKKLKHSSSHFVRFTSSNYIMKISHFRNNKKNFTFSFGRTFIMKNDQINGFTNFTFNATSFKKENISFELEYKSRFFNLTSKNPSHLTFQYTASYEFFPYKNNLMFDFKNLSKKTKNLPATNKTASVIQTQANDADSIVNQSFNYSQIKNSGKTADLISQKEIEKQKYSSSKYNQFASISLCPPVTGLNPNVDSLVFCNLGLILFVLILKKIRKFFLK